MRCIALNIASLVCAFVGNLFLLFNFTKRVRYIVALPATIILFYFASGILIGITSSMAIYVPPGKGEVYSQGFWHAVIAASLYLFCSMILMVNMLGYFLGHYPQHFTLTDEQRNSRIERIQNEVRNITRVLDDLLTLSRNGNDLVYSPVTVDASL